MPPLLAPGTAPSSSPSYLMPIRAPRRRVFFLSSLAQTLCSTIVGRSLSSLATGRSATSCPPSCSQKCARSLPLTLRRHHSAGATTSHWGSHFSPLPVPCSPAAPLSVITTAGHSSPPSMVPKHSPFSCDAAGITEASRRPPELPHRRCARPPEAPHCR
jgi:hypothetical protein